MIESAANAKFKRIQKLMKQARARKKEGVFVVEGWKMVREALQRDLVQELYCDEKEEQALAKELGPSNIQVICIAPGVIQTDMLNDIDEEIIEGLREETPLMRIGTVDDIANCALFLASDKSDFITGQVISPNGGFVI